MTPAAAPGRDRSDTLFAIPAIMADRRADGSIILKSTTPLRESARCIGDWLEHWARQAPDRDFPRRSRQRRCTVVDGYLQGCAEAGAFGGSVDTRAGPERASVRW